MEKILIRCNADYLQYEFPKRKWYQWINYNRIALMRLPFYGNDTLETDIGLEVYEYLEKEPSRLIDDLFLDQLYRALLVHYRECYREAEHLILLDGTGDALADLAYELANNRNYLSICTDNPGKYALAAEKIEMDYGLVPVFFKDEKDLLRYTKQMPDKEILLVNTKDLDQFRNSRWKNALLCSLPEKSFFADFSTNGIHADLVFKKRMKITYASIPIFLDNIVKNRYNAVVNEGITFQVIKDKKTVWRWKGNEDGRKEKYPDL